MANVKTPQSRRAAVAAAVAQLGELTQLAISSSELFGDDHADTLAAWDAVEVQGGIVHRQSRLLAGKTRGG
jgi:hypothetical protein